MINNDLLINTNGYILSLLEKILDAHVEIKGIENIPLDKPKMYVANHFTRTEAMLVPYTLYNKTNKKVGVIADDSLFKTYFGSFLKNLGAMKKSEENRNNHIIGDLITSCKDWMIFPEGRMVKAKDITKIDKNFCVKIDGACQRVHTGAAVFALTSQYLKQKYFDYKIDDFESFSTEYFIHGCKDISKSETMIVPINISFTRIRNGSNFLLDMAKKLIDDMGSNFQEELEIESNLILNSKIIIRILEPISTKDLIKEFYEQNLPQKELVNRLRYEITHSFMNKIYESLTISFDHIFILILYLYPFKKIEITHFKRLIYLVLNDIKNSKYFYDEEIFKDIIYLISYEKYIYFEDIVEVCLKDKIIEFENDEYIILTDNLLNNHTHHTIRLNNISKVILNEILVIEDIVNLAKDYVIKSKTNINNLLLDILLQEEKNDYESSYEKYKNYPDLKPKDIGCYKYFEAQNSDTCIIALHGFSSAPKEMEQIGLYFKEKNFNIIMPRLDGHGTVPEDLKNKSWETWYKSFSRSITIATLKYKKIFIIGFSTGGLLGLLSTKKHYKEFKGLICINAALKLNDIRINTVLPAISFWNDLVKAFNESDEEYVKEYVDNFPENPHINYNKHYITSIEELSLLMKKTKKILHKIKKPILILQGKDDPVVNSSSAYEIFENIESIEKTIKIIDANTHVIVLGDKMNEIYNEINDFINKFNQ